MEQREVIRTRTVYLEVLGDTTRRWKNVDPQLLRAHIIGLRLLTGETQARALVDKAPMVNGGNVRFGLVTWVDREDENVYDGGPVLPFAMNMDLGIPLPKDRRAQQTFTPVDWRGVNLRLSSVQLLKTGAGPALTFAWEFLFVERIDLAPDAR